MKRLAGETRFEHATDGFGDRYSTVEPLPYNERYYIILFPFRQEIFNGKTQKKEISTMKNKYSLGVIGGGFMARAILSGAISRGVVKAVDIIVSDVTKESLDRCSELGVDVISDNAYVALHCDILLLSVKPQTFSCVNQELEGISLPPVLSIMAGKTKRSIQSALNAPCVARAMPNLPCSIQEGAIGLDVSEFSKENADFVVKLFSATGKVVEVKESQLNAVTGISGSGSAYVYTFLKALCAAGVEQGLTQEQSLALAVQTVKGGVLHVENNPNLSLDQLISAVCSKGGTTIAALEQFEKDDFNGTVSRGVRAAVARAEELSK